MSREREPHLSKQITGQNNYLGGVAAEAAVEREYRAQGGDIVARRWRGRSGEIDLIFRDGNDVICVEVKKAKEFSGAAHRLSRHQLARIASAAQEFAGNETLGLLTPIRIDLALVNERGECRIIKNVTM